MIEGHATRGVVKKATKKRAEVTAWRTTYTVTAHRRCGHKHHCESLFESSIEAEAYERWLLDNTLCSDCLKAALTPEQRVGIAFLPPDHEARKDPTLIWQRSSDIRKHEEEVKRYMNGGDWVPE